MKWDELEEEPCSLARTVAVIGDRWSLLILRECFLRKRRFESFQSALGITRHLLAERLKKLVRLVSCAGFRIRNRLNDTRHPDAKRPRPLPGDHVDRALGQHPYDRLPRPADAS